MRRKAKAQNTNTMLPVALIVAGVVLVISVLIWQIARSAGQNTVVAPPTSAAADRNVPEPGIERVSLADAKKAFDEQQAIILDVRDAESYAAGHIPGAVNIPLALLENRASELDSNRWIITYCT